MSSKLEVTAYGLKGLDAAQFDGGREGGRGPVPGVERLSRHDADHGRREGRLEKTAEIAESAERTFLERSPRSLQSLRFASITRRGDTRGVQIDELVPIGYDWCSACLCSSVAQW